MATRSNHTRVEVSTGVFMLAGLVILGYLSVSIGGLRLLSGEHYRLKARFASVGDLSDGAAVRLAGVKVGTVDSIRLESYAAEATLFIQKDLALPTDTIASIRTEGLLGKSYVSLSPGADTENLAPGGQIAQTEPAIDLLDIISRYAFGNEQKGDLNGEHTRSQQPFSNPLE